MILDDIMLCNVWMWASLIAQLVRNLPAVQETGVQFLGWEDSNPLQYSCLENPIDRGAWRATVHGVARVGHDLATTPPPPMYGCNGVSEHEVAMLYAV